MTGLWLRTTHIFDGSTDIGPGIVEVTDAQLGAIRPDDRPVPADIDLVDLGDQVLSPGLVDVHCHGGGGAAFGLDPGPALATHRAHGTTTVIASLVSQQLDELERQVRMLAGFTQAGEIAGIHLEGPWLAPERKGAHPLSALRSPAPAEVNRLLDAGQGAVKMITVAPELEHGLPAIELMTARGVLAAVGHTNADYDTTIAAIEAGARGATHLFNAMPSLHHRDPGPILALSRDDRVWLELVADGIHLHIDLVAEMIRRWGDRVVLVTDAMAAAGEPDGDYLLGDLLVEVRDGVARLAQGGNIAGSTLLLDVAVRNVIAAGIDWQQALRCATSLPARYLNLPAGEIATGRAADLVVWDADWQPVRVMRHGRWLG